MPAARAASDAGASSGDTVTSHVAPASRSCASISCAVYSELIVVTVAPRRRMPWKTVANAGMFGHSIATTVPGSTLRAARAPANASTCARSVP